MWPATDLEFTRPACVRCDFETLDLGFLNIELLVFVCVCVCAYEMANVLTAKNNLQGKTDNFGFETCQNKGGAGGCVTDTSCTRIGQCWGSRNGVTLLPKRATCLH